MLSRNKSMLLAHVGSTGDNSVIPIDMATQTITRTPKKQLQPIRLLRVMQKNNLTFTQETTMKAKQFKFLELISLRYGNQVGTDLIYAYNDLNKADSGTLFLGDWGDGTVDEKEVVTASAEAEQEQ